MAEPTPDRNPFLGSIKPRSLEDSASTVESTVSPFSSDLESRSVTAHDESTASVAATVTPQKNRRWQNLMGRILIAGIALVFVLGAAYWWFQRPVSVEEPTPPSQPVDQKRTPLSPQKITESDQPAATGEAHYGSENFKAGEIVIGGELQFLSDADEMGALTIDGIRGEAFTEKNKQNVKLVVTWTTNKLTQAVVRYSKGIGQIEQSIDETDYGYAHSVIISGLDPASTYLYTIDVTDRYGNQIKSEPHAVFTGARTVSLFDLIAGAIGEVFGWAVTNK